MFETIGKVQPAFIARIGVEIGQHFVHAAELGVKHSLILGFGKPGKNPLCPFGDLYLDFESRLVTGIAISIPQTRERLVQDIPRHPTPVEVEAARTNISTGYCVQALPSTLLSTE